MLDRCRRKTNKRYNVYGGKGIKVCSEWNDYITFRTWALANKYSEDLTIHRLDSTKGYFPENCAWVPIQENSHARSKKIKCTNGKVYPSADEAAKDLGCVAQSVRYAARYNITICGYFVNYE